jgi:glycine/sarcosine/betaine reductase complex component C subunit beta
MVESAKPSYIGIEGVFYSLTHVPDLVRYGSKPSRELRANTTLEQRLKNQLRSFSAATAYAPHQVYIGNITPAELGNLPKPWYDNLIHGALPKGRFGDIVDQESFYGLLGQADQFNLVTVGERWFWDRMTKPPESKQLRLKSFAEIESLCHKGALPLYSDEKRVGCI